MSRQYSNITIFFIMFLLLLIAACSNGRSEPDASSQSQSEKMPNQQTAQEPPPVQKEPIELTLWFGSSAPQDDAHFMEVYGEFIVKKFPYITPKHVTYTSETTFEKMVASKTPIDLAIASIGVTSLVVLNNALQTDITEWIKKYDYDVNQLEPSTVEIQRQIANGGMYGLPVTTDSLTLFYNREVFDRFGLDQPQDGMTWEDVYEKIRAVARTEGDMRYWGLGVSADHVLNMDPLSPVIIDQNDRVLFATDRNKRVFETITQIFKIAGNEMDQDHWSYVAHLDMFQKQKNLAMLLAVSGLGYAYFADKDQLDWDVVSYPRYADQMEIGPQTYPVYFYVSSMSKHQEDAFLVSAYFTSAEFQTHMAHNGAFPVLRDRAIMAEYGKNLPYMADKNISAFLPQTFAEPAYKGKYLSLANSEMHNIFRKVALNETDLNTALREADEQVQKSIDEEKAR